MKYFTNLISIAAVFLAIIGAAFEFNLPIKDSLLTQYHEIQGKGQAAQKQSTNTKPNSFSVAKANDNNQEDSNSTKAMVQRGQTYLLKQVGSRINQLVSFRDRLQNMAVALNDPGMKSMVSGLAADIEAFEGLKAEISKSATNQDINSVTDKVKAISLKSSLNVEQAKSAVLAAKETQLVSDADATSSGMQKRIAALKAAGKDTKPNEELLAAYNKKIASAKQDVETANENFQAAASAGTDNEKQNLVKKSGMLLSSSQGNIRNAYKLLGQGAREEFERRIK